MAFYLMLTSLSTDSRGHAVEENQLLQTSTGDIQTDKPKWLNESHQAVLLATLGGFAIDRYVDGKTCQPMDNKLPFSTLPNSRPGNDVALDWDAKNLVSPQELTPEVLAIIPRNENGELLSFGSIGHSAGRCKGDTNQICSCLHFEFSTACVFFHNPSKGCKNGLQCLFCALVQSVVLKILFCMISNSSCYMVSLSVLGHFPHAPKARVRLSKRKRAQVKMMHQVRSVGLLCLMSQCREMKYEIVVYLSILVAMSPETRPFDRLTEFLHLIHPPISMGGVMLCSHHRLSDHSSKRVQGINILVNFGSQHPPMNRNSDQKGGGSIIHPILDH